MRISSKFFATAAALLMAAPMFAQGRVEVSKPTRQGFIPALRDVAPIPPTWHQMREKPEPKRLAGVDSVAKGQSDPLAASTTTTIAATLPATSLGFDGVGVPIYSVNAAPPDTNGAAGPTQYVQWVNEAFAVYSKSGALQYGPANGNTLFTSLGGYCAQYNDGDPIVLFDKIRGVWVMTQFAVSQGASRGYRQCVAVSKTSDATGAWNTYEYNYGTNFNDYPKVGVWSDGYYITYNIFKRGRTFGGGQVCALDAAGMIAGSPKPQQCYNFGTSYGGVLPSDFDGATAIPAGSPNYLVNFGTNLLNVWRFKVDWNNSANTTMTKSSISVAAFSRACGGGTCVPQAGTSNQLDSLADRMMYRFAYRNRGTAGQSLVVTHSVANGTSTGVRWYELRLPANSSTAFPALGQQGTFAPDTKYRWMSSAAMDKVGNIVMGYSVSSSTMAPDIYYTAHLAGDAAGTMNNGEVVMTSGTRGSQTGTLHRWGDYSSMSVDPSDDCTMWYTTEYLHNNGSFNWSTRIGTVKMSTCQ